MTTSFIFDTHGNRKYLNQKERHGFMAAAVHAPQEVHSFCAVLAYTGARISEVLALTAAHIDFGAEVIVFESLKKRRKGHYRAVPVPRHLLQVLDAIHCVRHAQANEVSKSRPLWPWSRTTAWLRVKEVMRRADIQGAMASPKGLRHGLGVSAIQSGIPLNIVQKWLGHTHLHTTAIYANAMGPEERAFAHKLWRGFERREQGSGPTEAELPGNVVAEIHSGPSSVFEIVRRDAQPPENATFHIYRNGKQYPGTFASLAAAAEVVERAIS